MILAHILRDTKELLAISRWSIGLCLEDLMILAHVVQNDRMVLTLPQWRRGLL
jgi:hypothetical protein